MEILQAAQYKILTRQNEIESFGVDESQEYDTVEEEQRVLVPRPYHLSEQQTEFVENVRQALPNDDNGIATYHEMRRYLRNELE